MQEKILNIVSKVSKTNYSIKSNEIDPKENIKIIIIVFIFWLIVCFAYLFFLRSLYNAPSIWLGFILPLSLNLGILAIIAPAGLGIREGVIIAYFALFDVPLEISSSISILTRFWFMYSEIFIFLVGLWGKFRSRE